MSRYFFATYVGVIRVDGNMAYVTWENETKASAVPLPLGPHSYIKLITNCGWQETCSRKYNRACEEYARRRREHR